MTTQKITSSAIAGIGQISPQTFGNIMGCGNGIMPSSHINDAMEYLGVAYTLLAEQARQTVMAQAPAPTPAVALDHAQATAFTIAT